MFFTKVSSGANFACTKKVAAADPHKGSFTHKHTRSIKEHLISLHQSNHTAAHKACQYVPSLEQRWISR